MKNLKAIDFNIIRYANCWEDADLLLRGLQAQPNGRHLSIGSAGDNSFSLLRTNPEVVLAVDISPVQIYLIELKKAAIRNLSQAEYLWFAGFTNKEEDIKRWTTYCSFRDQLPTGARRFWDQNRRLIFEGIIYNGKFERYFLTFAQRVLPWIHDSSRVQFLLEKKDQDQQRSFYQKRWNNRRWRWLFRLFFSRKIMGWLGRDPAFLKQVNVKVSDFIFQKAAQHLSSTLAQENHILDFALTGRFKNNLPHYVRPGNYEIIQSQLDKLICLEGPVEAAIQQYGRFDYFNLSNIFEYLNESQFATLSKKLLAGAMPGATLAYWNLMVDRKISNISESLIPACNLDQLRSQDKGFFYQNFLLERMVA